MLRVLSNNPEVFKVNQILHTLNRLKKELFTDPSQLQDEEDSSVDPKPQTPAAEKNGKMQQYVDLSIKVAAADQFLKLKIEEIQSDRQLSSKKAIKQQPDNRFLLKSEASLAYSTTGLHLHRLRSKKMTGGIFELIKLKQRLDALQKERGITPTLDLQIPQI